MKILGLDLSTHSGYAIIEGGRLSNYGIIEKKPKQTIYDGAPQEYFFIYQGHYIADQIDQLITSEKPNFIYIEQTNQGRNRTTQKELEFIHCIVLEHLAKIVDDPSVIRFVNTSTWRPQLGIRLNKTQKKHNKTRKSSSNASIITGDYGVTMSVRGRITVKHLSVLYANGKYNLSLKLKDNDIADAICIAQYGFERETDLINFCAPNADCLFDK
jgi:Holliday junction resolvasome RuvABC endonuclease subunit